jgi:isopentenyldiphosphate isomerase
METELIKIFDDNGTAIGVTTREEVHKKGYWHETFHCWFTSKEAGVDYLFFQLRSDAKKDYPNLLDITAAGHILANETVNEGIREVKEELGIDVTLDELISLGVIKYCVVNGDMIDKELAHVYLYDCRVTMDQFKVQQEEVSGVVKIEMDNFYKLFIGEVKEIRVEGFEIDKDGKRVLISKNVSKNDFVPHEESYYESIIKLIDKNMN